MQFEEGQAALAEQPKLTVATIRKRKKIDTIYTDAACTPLYIAERLPVFDIDPASNPRTHIRSHWSYSLEKKLDGLRLPWRGSAFLNWPYSFPLAWALKSTHEMIVGHCTELVVLCKLDTSTKWWHEITAPILGPIDLWFLDERVQYDEHPEVIKLRQLERLEQGKPAGDGTSSNNFCSCIIHHKREDARRLELDAIASLWNRAIDVAAVELP